MTVHGLWKRAYPRDWIPYSNLAGGYVSHGRHEDALENGLKAIRINPDEGMAYLNIVDAYMGLNRYDDAKRVIDAAEARHLFGAVFRDERFRLAFALEDENGMARERLAASGGPGEADIVWDDSEVAAFRGHVKQARALRAVAERLAGPRLRLNFAAFGAMFDAAVGLAAHLPDVTVPTANVARYHVTAAALLSHDVRRAAALLREDEPPPDSLRFATACRALLGAEMGDRSAIEAPSADTSKEMGQFMGFKPLYIRGLAYLQAGDGGHAAAEFKRIIDHRGVDVTSPLYPLAYVQRARAEVMAGDRVQAQRDYKTFLALWADADTDIPILQEAKAEYARSSLSISQGFP